MKVCFETFGCRLNRAEALEQEAAYLARGWTLTDSHDDADLLVIRGCSVTARAQADCEKLVAHLRRVYPFKKLIVTGCLADKSNAKTRGDIEVTPETPVSTRTARAYLKVQDGCSGKCTFCIVPRFRGTSKSIPFGDILDRARRMIDAGYKEIVVTGCNLSLFASEGKRLPELLSALAELSDETRIRLGSLEPSSCARDVVDVIAERENLCRFLHLPIQSGSDLILAAMNRPYRVRDVTKLLDHALVKLPSAGYGCDLIAGFPGETPNDHFATRGLLTRYPFSNVHAFPFSPRPNTLAAGLPGQISSAIRHGRAHELADLATHQRAAFARTFIGKTVEIVCEGHTTCRGWTSEYLACRAMGPAQRKSRVRVRVMAAHSDGSLEGHVLRS